MPDTTNYAINMPTVGADTDTWGTELNDALELFDGYVFTNQTNLAGKLNLTGGTLTGILNGTSIVLTTSLTAPAIVGALTGNVTGNATTATALATGRTIGLTGVITAAGVSFNGSTNISLTTAIADAALTIAKTSGLQSALDAKEATLNANQKRAITYGTAAPSGTPADGDIYLKHEA